MMTAIRWTRRALDALLLAAMLVVAITAGITLLAPVLGGRALVIGGGSMEPTIGRGALVLTLAAPDGAPVVGDVVTVQQGGSTPYTHRIVRLAEMNGVPYVETKGDANPGPDPALVPAAAILGTIVLSIPLLGYLSLVLGTAAGLAGFLALCATALLLTWVLEDLEDERLAVARVEGEADPANAGLEGGGAADLARARAAAAAGAASSTGPGLFSALPAFATPSLRTHVRMSGRARDPWTPVLLEADRRNPRRRGIVTAPCADESATPDRPDGHGDPGGPAGDLAA
jgi:signal peptidase I